MKFVLSTAALVMGFATSAHATLRAMATCSAKDNAGEYTIFLTIDEQGANHVFLKTKGSFNDQVFDVARIKEFSTVGTAKYRTLSSDEPFYFQVNFNGDQDKNIVTFKALNNGQPLAMQCTDLNFQAQ
jgi:hypothetical protein